jgi:large subunit ribosomal protein L10
MRQEKQLLLDEIRQKMEASPALILTRYSKWSAGAAHQFRRGVRAQGAEFEVVRKRVFLKAAQAAGVPVPEEWLVGHIGVVFIQGDPLATAKEIDRFSQQNESALEVVGGRIEGQMMAGADVVALSKLPGKDEMRAQLLGLFEAPMGQTLAVVEALLTSVAHAAENRASQGLSN